VVFFLENGRLAGIARSRNDRIEASLKYGCIRGRSTLLEKNKTFLSRSVPEENDTVSRLIRHLIQECMKACLTVKNHEMHVHYIAIHTFQLERMWQQATGDLARLQTVSVPYRF